MSQGTPPPVVQAQPPLPPPGPLPPLPPPPGVKPPAPPPAPAPPVAWEVRWGARVALGVGVVTLLTTAVGVPVWINGKIDDTRRELSGKIDDTRREVSGKIDDTRKDVAEVRIDVAKLAVSVSQIDTRLTRIEAKVGVRHDGTDGGAGWSAEHIARREKLCRPRCNFDVTPVREPTKADVTCYDLCSAEYNACGIKCPSDPVSNCFRDCVAAMRQK